MTFKPHHNQIFDIGDFQFIYKANMSIEEWLDTRKDGIGGSDIGVIMGVNMWMCATRLFFEKLGLSDPKDLTDNDSVHWGRLDEPIILDQSQYWDESDPLQYMRNYWSKNRRFSHVDFPFFVINKSIPWLRMNVDGLGFNDINITEEMVANMIFSGIIPDPDKIIEIKTINERATERWAHGIPYGYIYQVLGYLAAWAPMDVNYAEIYSRVAGTKLQMHPVEYDESKIQEMLEETYLFWELIEHGRKILAELPLEEAEAELWNIAPPPEGKKDYFDFLSEKEILKQSNEKHKISGTDRELEWAYKYKEAKAGEAINKAEADKYKALLYDHMIRQGGKNCNVIDFGEEGRVTKSSRIYVNVA